MTKQKIYFMILFCCNVKEIVASPSKEELIEAWNQKLSSFYITIPNDTKKRFLTEELRITGIAYEHKNYTIGM